MVKLKFVVRNDNLVLRISENKERFYKSVKHLLEGNPNVEFCIFGSKDQFASAAKVSPIQAENIIQYETSFGCTIKRNANLRGVIESGTPYQTITQELIDLATSSEYNLTIIFDSIGEWVLPAEAFGESCGSM